MKQRLSSFAALAVLALVAGCAAIEPGNDPVVVRAEQTVQGALDTLDAFVTWEYANQIIVKERMPEVHQWAETIRKNGLSWVSDATTAIRTYKTNRSADNKATMETAVATVSAIVSMSQKYLTQGINGLK